MRKYWIGAGSILMLVVMLLGCENSEITAEPANEIQNQPGSSVHVPAIKLPKNTGSLDMVGLIVYKGKIYTQTAIPLDADHAKSMMGEKLGRTKGSIDEWSKQDDYAQEFASSIGEVDVYTVKGYDTDFRIMAYQEQDGQVYAEYYECLNGMTVHDGNDIFGKIKLVGNVMDAKYRTYNDWNNSVENYRSYREMNVVAAFVEELNRTVPYSLESAEEILGDYRNDESYRELTLLLKDGSKVQLIVIKGGYIRYPHLGVFFKMDNELFTRIWDEMVEEQQPDQQLAPTEQQSVEDMTQFLYLLKAKDADGLLKYLKRTNFYAYLELEQVILIIEGFERNFDLETLTEIINYDGLSMSPENRQFEFILEDKNHSHGTDDDYDETRIVTLRYEIETGQPIVHNPYVRNYPFAEKMVKKYMELIAQDKVSDLAKFMNADDLDIPDWVAEQTITAYNDKLDFDSISIRNDHGFIYTIEDEKGNSHTIEVIYGDGLMGIRDDFKPDYSG